jgi:low temperature requirement protein LtrA
MTASEGDAAGGTAGSESPADDAPEGDGRSVGNLELFFDLTFVYAMSQVTHLMLADVSWQGFGRGVLALLALWWAWVCYAWLTNSFEMARIVHTMLIVAAMAGMLVAVIALPDAFTTGALVFGLALFAVRLINAGMFIASSLHDEAELASAIRRLVPGLLIGPCLIVGAAFVDHPCREALWIAAALVDFGSPLLVGTDGLRVVPSYFIERHGSVIIIALGEAIVALGAVTSQDLRHPGVLVVVVCGVVISATLWWTYFGLTGGAEERMRRTPLAERPRLALDAYSYLHLPLIAGIVFFAVGTRVAVEDVGEPLAPLPALALTGGVASFYAAEVAYRWRDHHQLTVDRLLAAAASLLVLPLAMVVPAVGSLAVLTTIGVLRLGWELWRRPQIGTATPGLVR